MKTIFTIYALIFILALYTGTTEAYINSFIIGVGVLSIHQGVKIVTNKNQRL